MELERIRHLIRVWRDRYLELGSNPLVRYVLIFENRGEAITATASGPATSCW